MNNHIQCIVCDVFTHPGLTSLAVEVETWISIYILQYYMDVIICSAVDLTNLKKEKRPRSSMVNG